LLTRAAPIRALKEPAIKNERPSWRSAGRRKRLPHFTQKPNTRRFDMSVPKNDPHAPSSLTFTENLILTLKVLGGLGLIGAGLWAANVWTAAN
jgi:hypothetical protein